MLWSLFVKLCQPVMSFLVCELCYPVATSSHPLYITLISARNLFEISFYLKLISISWYTLPPQSSLQKITQCELRNAHPQILATGFKIVTTHCYCYCYTLLLLLLHIAIATATHCYCCWGRLYKLRMLCVLLDASIM